MSDKRISQLVERVTIANNDVLPIVALNAATTNKVTISTIQDWMQTNLNMGVTSVAITLPTGLSVTGSPITSTGTFAISFTAGYSIPTTAKQTEWDTAYTNRITSATAPLGIASNVISITQSGAASDGYLSSTDWTTFNNKQSTITTGNLTEATSSVLTITGGTGAVLGSGTSIQVKQASGSQDGFLDSADWTTFNDKQNALSGTGIVKSTGGTISYLTDNTSNWDSAYNDKINSAAVTGTTTKTLTLTQQDGGTITTTWTDLDTGTVTSVGVSMPSAFSVANSPITSSGTIAITGAGTISQYIDGTGALRTFPTIIAETTRLVREVYNNSGTTMTKGTVVYINGGQGNLPTIARALATGDATSAQTYGVVQTSIGNMSNGYIVVVGDLIDMDTQAFVEGTQLYLSPTTAGEYTSTKPYAPQHLVYVGIVTRSHPTQGIIAIKIQNGFEMDELHNVSAQNPNNNDILQYKTATGLWTKTAGTTSNISEGSNLYYTDARSRSAFSESVTGLDYNSTTGVLSTTTGYGIPTAASQTNWDAAYNDKINSAAVTGTTTKTLTLNQQDGGTITASWTDINTDAVSSVFGRTGAVVATSGDYNTDQVTEGTSNLYFTNARSRSSITLTTTGTSNVATYNSTTGVLNIPNYTYTLPTASTSVLGGVKVDGTTITINGSGVISGANTYSLPIATASVLGGVKIGTGIGVDVNGIISVTGVQSQLNGTGFVKASGTTITYDNSTYALDSAVVHIAGTETITGIKTFSANTFFSANVNINGTANDGDIAVHARATAGAGKYIYVGRDSSDQWKFSVRSDGFTNIGSGTSADARLLLIQSSGNNLDTGAVIRLVGNVANDLLDISVADTTSRIYHQENSTDAANGYGLIQFRTNAAPQSSYPFRGGFKFTVADGDALVITNERKAIFNSDVTLAGNVTFGNYIISDVSFADGYKLMMRNPSMSIDSLKASYFGYSTGYGVLIVGHTGANNRSLAFGVDISGNPSGAFSGWGSEYIWRGAASFITPNATNNGYNTLLSWNSSGQVTINNLLATTFSFGNNLQLGDYSGSTSLTFASSSNGIAKINFYDANSTEGIYLRTDGESYGGTMTFGARWDDDEAKIVFKMYQVSAGGTYNARVGIGTGAINPLSMLHVCELDGGNYLGSLRVGGSTGFGIVMDYTQSAFTTATMYASPTYNSADVLFKLGAGLGNTNQLVLKGNGRIGIGGVSPLGILDVYRAAGGSGTSAIVISNGEVNGRNWALSTEVVTGGDFAILSSTTAGGIPAPSGANTKLYILAGGNIGMGTTTVPGRLTAKYSSYSAGQTPLYIGNTGFTNWSRQAYDTFVLQQDDVTSFRMVEKNGEDTTSDQILSFSIGDGSAVIASSAQPMKFYTNGSPSGLAYQGLSGTLSMTLQTNGNALFGYSITASGDIIAFSDIRYKENIRPIENALDRITKSRGVLYDRKNGGNKNNIGFIAQELELQFPELISVNADGTLGVKYQNAVAVLFEAMKEQQKQIEELKKQVA